MLFSFNENEFGNSSVIFTNSGSVARRFARQVETGQVGVNVAMPIPPPTMAFTGNKGSFRGQLHGMGQQGIDFLTQTRTVTSLWNLDDTGVFPKYAGGRVNGKIAMAAAALQDQLHPRAIPDDSL